jgi:hypothetical protein
MNMPTINNYGLGGVGDNIQFGKKGTRIKSLNGQFEARDLNDSTYVPIAAGDPVNDNDLVTKSYLETVQQAGDTLRTPEDGDLTDNGAITTWEVGTTTYTNALDNLNEILGRLVPAQPPALSSFSISPTGGNNEILASGATDNTGGNIPAAGTTVYTIYDDSIVTTQANGGSGATGGDVEGNNGNLFTDGASGDLTAFINGVQDGTITLTEASEVGSYTSLQVVSDVDYPASTPGFYKAIKARINKSSGVPVGYNNAQLTHSDSGSTNTIAWVHDDVAAAPTISGTGYSLGTSTTGKYSSGIKHLTNGDTINVDGTVSNLTGQTYITSNVLTYTTSPSVGTLAMDATELGTGLTFPLDANLAPQTISGKSLTIGTTARFVQTNMFVSAYNPRGSDTNNSVAGDNILVYTTALEGGNKPHEVQVNGSSADAYRHYLGSGFTGDTPSGSITAPTASNWDSSQLLNAAGYEHEAVVVAGAIKHDTTNYTTGHIPTTTGADYSTKDASQYVTYVFNQATLSSISLSISGNYSGLWVSLPGISDDAGQSPNALGGNWWDAFALYNGSGVPGRTGDTNAGCAVGSAASGSSGTVDITFGTASSTNATNNAVIVRIKLTAGQSISAISISNTP